MEYIHQLAYIAMVLLIGTFASVIAYKFKTSDVFILLLTGMIFSNFGLLSFNKELVIIMSVLALIFIVFNSSFRFKLKELKKYFLTTLKLNVTYFALCATVLTVSVIYVFELDYSLHSVLIGLLFSVLAYGIDPSAMISSLKESKSKIIEIMEIESIITPVVGATFSILLLNSLGGHRFQITMQVGNTALSILQSIFIGIIFAISIGLIVITILKNNYLGELTHLGVITSAIIVYVGSEYFGGNGVLSIVTFGLMFGNSHISHLIEIERFESIFTNSIKILTFMFLGTIIMIKQEYILNGTILFFIYLLIRFVSVMIVFVKEKIKMRQIVFISLNVPKGVEGVVILLLIITMYSDINNIDIVINPLMIMILYSIAISSVVTQFSSYFITNKKGKSNVKKI